jgi:hypothetical protein
VFWDLRELKELKVLWDLRELKELKVLWDLREPKAPKELLEQLVLLFFHIVTILPHLFK